MLKFITYLFAVMLLLNTSLKSQNIFNEPVIIPNLEGKITVNFDTISNRKANLELIYKNGNTNITCKDTTFTNMFSERELSFVLKDKKDCLLAELKKNKFKDSTLVATDLLPALNQAIPGWYKQIRNKMDSTEKVNKLIANFSTLAYNDSIKAALAPNRYLLVYKVVRKSSATCQTDSTSKYCDSNVFSLKIPITRIQMAVNDGFIYSMNFDIDTTSLPDTVKNVIQDHQAFSIRYNLRHNILANGMIHNQFPIILKKKHTNYRSNNISSGYVFYIDELIHYLSPSGTSSTIFTAKDTIITFLTSKNGKQFDTVFLREKSLYSIINLDVFGDMVGFFDNTNPNGLIQTELKANFYGFRRPWKQGKTFTSRFTSLNKGEVFFRLSKLDNKNRYLSVYTDTLRREPTSRDSAIKYVHGYRLLEYQNIYAGLRINLGEFEYRGGSLALTSELSFLRTPLQDTILVTQQKPGRVDTLLSPINYGKNSLLFVPGLKLKIHAASFLDLDLHSKFYFLHPLTTKVNNSKSEFDEFYGKNSYDKITTTKMINLGATIIINLDNDKTRRLKIRGENYIDLNAKGNNFWQAQIGYSADLNRFISLNTPSK